MLATELGSSDGVTDAGDDPVAVLGIHRGVDVHLALAPTIEAEARRLAVSRFEVEDGNSQ